MKKLMCFGALMLAITTTAQAGAIIVGKDSPINSMDVETAKNVFLGRRPILDGQALVVLFQKEGSPARQEFDSKVIGKTGAELSSYLSKQIFTGRIAAPTLVDGDAAVRAKVAASPAAIGYVGDDGIDSTVKVILKY